MTTDGGGIGQQDSFNWGVSLSTSKLTAQRFADDLKGDLQQSLDKCVGFIRAIDRFKNDPNTDSSILEGVKDQFRDLRAQMIEQERKSFLSSGGRPMDLTEDQEKQIKKEILNLKSSGITMQEVLEYEPPSVSKIELVVNRVLSLFKKE